MAFPLHDSQKVADKVSQDNSTDNRPKILIVDDDTEVVHYLRTLLAPSYRIIYRFDAESALKATREEEPSLILSDVVMPGIEVSDKGEIKYNGKAINKFYIEGHDMLGGRYSIATNNIHQKDVGSVEEIGRAHV